MRTLLVLSACLAFQCAWAAPFAVQLGDARVALDAPPGFADVQSTGSPRLLELAESLTSASNRILLFGLEDIDVRRFNVGDSPEFRRYCLVVTPRQTQGARVTQAAFRQLVSDALRELGAPAAAGADLRGLLDGARGRSVLIAELKNEHEVTSILHGARLPDAPRSRDAPKYLLSSTTLILVRGRALNLSLYAPYETPADLDWIRTVTVHWVEEVQRLNR